MGDGYSGKRVRLYAFQAAPVMETLLREGVCYSKEAYVKRKYGESAWSFLAAYRWFIKEAEKYVPKPEGAEFPYWAYGDLWSFDKSGGGTLLTLSVPVEEAAFFRVEDWTRILCMRYLGTDEKDAAAFSEELRLCGLREETVMASSFYPEQKARITGSWERLFRFHEEIKRAVLSAGAAPSAGEAAAEKQAQGDGKAGAVSGFGGAGGLLSGMQAGLWRLKKDWIIS